MSQQPRPAQATFAGWLIIGGSVVLVISAWQRVSGLHTLEVQEELRRMLGQPPFSGTDMSLDALTTTIRVLCMVGAAAATACAILGVEALRKRSASARLALSVLAPFVLVGGFATAGFFAPLVVAGIVMLWMRPTRDWLAGRPWMNELAKSRLDPFAHRPRDDRPGPGAAPGPSEPAQDREPVPTPAPPRDEEQPQQRPAPYVTPGPPPSPTPYGASTPYPPPPPYGAFRQGPPKRPGALVAACVVVWATCALVATGTLLTALALATMPDDVRADIFAEMERQQGPLEDYGVTQDDVVVGTYVLAAFVVPWCVAAMVLAFLAFRRVGWARIALLASTGLAGALSLATAIASPPMVVVVGACVAVTWLLLRPDVGAWFRR